MTTPSISLQWITLCSADCEGARRLVLIEEGTVVSRTMEGPIDHSTDQRKSSRSTTCSTRHHSEAQSCWREFKQQCKTAFPTLAGMLLYKIPWLISLRFVGGIGSKELAAAALAATLCNVTGLSLSVGLSSAMTTLTGQARGDLQHKQEVALSRGKKQAVSFQDANEQAKETTSLLDRGPPSRQDASHDSGRPLLPLVFLYRGLFTQLAFVLPVGVWWIVGIEPTLSALGQDRELSEMTEAYLRILTPGLWSYSINWTLTAWLQALEMADVPAYAAAVGLALHVPFNHFFIYTLGWGYLGVAVATVMFQLIQPALILTYVFGTEQGRLRFLRQAAAQGIGRTRLSLVREARIALDVRGIGQYLSLAIPGIVVISEWWASETSIFLSGRLFPFSDLALGGMTLYQSMNTFCFMFPVACGVAGSTRVGNLLGADDPEGAILAAKVSVLCSGSCSLLLAAVLFWTPHTFFPSLFAPDEEDLVAETSRTITLLSIYVLADGIQSAFNGIVKGCGRQFMTMPIVVVAYWCVGIPLAYYVAFVHYKGYMCTDNYFCGIVGLVFGMTVGTWVHMLSLGVALLATTDWETEAKKAKDRLGAHPPDAGPSNHRRRLSGEEAILLSM